MGNPKGSIYERQLMVYLREQGFDAERLRLTGTLDEGDLQVRADRRVVLEAKNRKGMNLAGWVGEAEVERENYADSRGLDATTVRFAVVHKRAGKGVAHSYVTIPLYEYLEYLR